MVFVFKTEDYYICCLNDTKLSGVGDYLYYTIRIVDMKQNLAFRAYNTPIWKSSSNRASIAIRPENPRLLDNGTRLTYTTTLEADAYHRDSKDTVYFQKGIYTVTMDLKTGEQTYTRADLP